MNYKKIFELAKERGISDLELYISKATRLSIRMFHQNVEKYNVSDSEILSARGIYKGKMGCASTEKLTNDSIEFIVNAVIENASIIEENKDVSIFAGSPKYKKMKTHNDSFAKKSVPELIEKMKIAETCAMEYDKKIADVGGLEYEEIESKITIINSKGLKLSQTVAYGMFYIETVAKDGEDVKTGFSYQIMKEYSEFDPVKVAKDAAKQAINKLHAQPVKSKKYKIVLDAKVMSSMVNSLTGSIYGEEINEKRSKLVDKLNCKIASSKFTLIEDPHNKKYPYFFRGFDDEGVATYKKNIIEKGVLKTFLYNIDSASKAKTTSTGNGYKNSPQGMVSTNTSLLVVKPGNKTLDELLAKMKNGLYITEIQGIHAGMDTLSGNFSLQSSGFEVVDGKITKAVNLITIAGNLFDMFADIQLVGNDSFCTYGSVLTPSVLIKKLSVSGK